MANSNDQVVWDLTVGDGLIPKTDLHEDQNASLPLWFTAGQNYVIESVHPIANPPFAMVMCNDGKMTRLNGELIKTFFTVSPK